MKTIRRILALLLALSVVLALGVGVFADGETAYTITVTSGSSNISIKGCEYKAYRLFDATYFTTETEDKDGNTTTTTNVGYTLNADFKDFTYTVGEDEDEKTYSGNDLIDYVRSCGESSDTLNAFAKAVLKYIQTKNIAAAGSATLSAEDTAGNEAQTVTIDNLPGAGYYLVTGTAGADNNQTVTAACALTTAKPTAEITLKADVPTVDKKIVENNGDVDENTASIGDKVNYKITSSVPNMKGYDSYWFVLEDTLSKGLTYNGDIVVTVGGVTLEGHSDGAETADDFGYKATATENRDGTTSIEIALHNFIQYKDNEDRAIVVTYSATVNQDAELDPNTGNPNTVKLIYSNNPNVQYDGDKWQDNPENPGRPSDITGETPEAKVNTFVTGIKLTKTDKESNTLIGAKFQISGESMKVVLINEVIYKASENGTYYMLKDGTYTTTGPNEENKASYDSIETKYEKVTAVDKTTETSKINATGYVNAQGVLKFEGLGEGTYTITELIAPNGYNLLKDPITIEITAEETVAGCTWTVNQVTKNEKNEEVKTPLNANTAHLYELTVVNNAGTELPSTGGMGTTLFYVIGGLLVVCAGVILVTRKRMSREG